MIIRIIVLCLFLFWPFFSSRGLARYDVQTLSYLNGKSGRGSTPLGGPHFRCSIVVDQQDNELFVQFESRKKDLASEFIKLSGDKVDFSFRSSEIVTLKEETLKAQSSGSCGRSYTRWNMDLYVRVIGPLILFTRSYACEDSRYDETFFCATDDCGDSATLCGPSP